MGGNGLTAEFSVFGAYRALRAETESEVVRVAQEAIHNVKKHAAASRLSVQLEYGPETIALEATAFMAAGMTATPRSCSAPRAISPRRAISRTAVFIFQPAEEGLGGARAMIGDGLFEQFPCDEIYGLHNAPDLEPNQVASFGGPAMAGTDFR